MGLNVILMGPPGSGKGTQAEFLVDTYDLWHVSTGNILRACVRDGLRLGDKRSQEGAQEGSFSFSRHIASILKAGQLVPDDIMMDLIRETLQNEPSEKEGWLLDGYPRTRAQAEGLVKLLEEMDQTPPVVLEISVADEEIVSRLSGRVSCDQCGHPAKRAEATEGDECRRCGGALFMREDDQPQTVLNRLAVFREKTAPAKEILAAAYGLQSIDGVGALNEVSERIAGVLAAKD